MSGSNCWKNSFLVRLEDLPRRIGDNYIKTAARLDDLVIFVTPMEGRQRFNIFGISSGRFTALPVSCACLVLNASSARKSSSRMLVQRPVALPFAAH